MCYDRLELPTERLVTAQQILTGIALLEIDARDDAKNRTYILKVARSLNKLKSL